MCSLGVDYLASYEYARTFELLLNQPDFLA